MNGETQIYLDEINIRSILRDFLNHWWLFLLAAISALLLLSSYGNLIYKETFTSSATLVVSAKGKGTTDTYADLTTTSGMASVFSDIFSSNVLRELVAEELGASAGSFSIRANITPETNLMVVQVSGDNPRTVHLAIGEALEHCAEVSEDVFSNAVLDVLQQPSVIRSASNSFASGSYRKLAVLAAAAVMAAIIGTLSVLRGTVKTEAAARRQINGKKLALIGHEEKNRTLKAKMKALTKAILITNPTTSFGYLESFRKLSFRIHSDMKAKNQKVLLVTSIGENEGKSTVASNIALALAQSGKRVVLADFDLRRPAIYKIFDMAGGEHSGMWKETCQMSGAQRLELILNNHPAKNPVAFLKEADLGAMIAKERQNADYIIIDSSPVGAAADTELMTAYADAVLLVVRQDWSHVTEINRFIDTLSKNNKEFLGYVLNDFENPNPMRNKQYNYDYGKHYGKYGYGETGR